MGFENISNSYDVHRHDEVLPAPPPGGQTTPLEYWPDAREVTIRGEDVFGDPVVTIEEVSENQIGETPNE